MKKLNIKILMLVFCACVVQNVGAQVVRVYTNDGAVREISSVEKVTFHNTQNLGKSLYQELQSRKTFTTTLRLIDDLGYTEKFSAKGSFTLFAASDAAFAEFFKRNAWNVTSYATLSKSQKLQLLKMSLLNEAYSLDAVTTTYDGDDAACLRHNPLTSESDFVVPFAPSDLPTSSEEGNDAFKPLRDKGTTSYLSTTGNVPMLNQFYANVLKRNNIPVSDIELMMGHSWNVSGQKVVGYLNDCRILEGGITCSNGYLYILDKVLFPVGSTVEHIRTNTDTQLFYVLIERFLAPYYSAELTEQYNQENLASVDSVYEMGFRDLPVAQYFYNASQHDIPTMFVPSNEAVIDYFVNGAGAVFVEEYGKLPNTADNLSQNLKNLPNVLVGQILENVMGHNFTSSAPSKNYSIKDTDLNNLFSSYGSANEYYNAVVKQCLFTSNGIVYVTKVWPSITEHMSVMTPLSISTDTKIFNTVATADDKYIDGTQYNDAPLKQYFSTYLKAMPNHFSFFIPTDEALGAYGYVDPVGFAKYPYGKRTSVSSSGHYYWRFAIDTQANTTLPIGAVAYLYDQRYGQRTTDKKKGSQYVSGASDLSSTYSKVKRQLLIEMMNQHLIVHESDQEISTRKYFMSRSGAPVCVASVGSPSTSGVGLGVGATVKGGFQLMLDGDEYVENDHVATVQRAYDFTMTSHGKGNGMTYVIDRPLQPTMRSVYNVMNVTEGDKRKTIFSDFYALADPRYVSEDLLRAIGLIDETSYDDTERQKSKYLVFVSQYDAHSYSPSYNPASNETLVRFFNNFNYTIYVPTNEQVQEARNNGLMTWGEIEYWVAGKTNNYETELSEADRIKAQAMVTTLVNFVKYHFQDRSVFLDNVSAEDSYVTSCYNSAKGGYVRVNVKQSPAQISITDAMGNQAHVVNNEGTCNILARDMNYDSHYTSATQVKNSSYVVIHQIDKYLNYHVPEDYKGLYFEGDPSKGAMPVGRFDFWEYARPEQIETYVAKYKPQF